MKQPGPHKNLLSDSLRIFFIKFFSPLASLIVTIYFAHSLPAEDYGRYQSFWVQLTLMTAIAGAGLGLIIFSYPPEQLRHILLRLRPAHRYGYGGIVALFALVFTWLQHDPGTSLAGGLIYFLFFLCYFANIFLEAFITVIRRHGLLIWSGLGYSLLFAGIAILISRLGHYRLAYYIGCLLPFGALRALLLARAFYQFLQEGNTSAAPAHSRKEIATLWAQLGFYDLMNVAAIWLDKFVLSLISAAAITAVYVNGTVNIPFIPVALSAVGNATLMQLQLAASYPDKARLARQAGKLLSCIAYPAFFFLLIYRYEFITTIFSEKYLASVPIFLCAILILPVRAYSNTTILQNLHQGRIINQGSFLDLVLALALAYPLYLLLDLPGIALSFVISTYVQVLFYLYHSARLLGVPVRSLVPLRNWLFKAAVFAVVTLVLHTGLSGLPPLYNMAIAVAVNGALALLLLRYEMRASKEDTNSAEVS